MEDFESKLKPFKVLWTILIIVASIKIYLDNASGGFSIWDTILILLFSPIWIFILWSASALFSAISAFCVYPLMEKAKGIWLWFVAALGISIFITTIALLGKCGCSMSDEEAAEWSEYQQRHWEPR